LVIEIYGCKNLFDSKTKAIKPGNIFVFALKIENKNLD
jgi:hypothetical protein